MPRSLKTLSLGLLVCLCSATANAQQPIEFTRETLPNGLQVIYAPMKNAPVVHVRVLYHVGSRDEREDRQGFAHLFEHMMFRGSAHVAPEQHMKLIGTLGGDSNAFTSFDQTTYTNTLPSTGLEMALYLEADRLASFKVDDKIFQTERNVVAEEWRMRYANQPLGGLNLDVLRTAFTKHGYRWTPIGDMDQLREATSSELQQFFNRYYLPNNACLVIAGDVNIAQTRQWVEKYFGWIPAGPEVKREDRVEPEQTQTRRLVVEKPNVPLTNMVMAFKAPDYKSDDQYALYLLGDILASGRTGRLDRALVTGENPTCVSVGAGSWQLEDPSLFMVNAVVQKDAEPEAVQKQILVALAEIADKGVEQAELDRVIAQTRQALIRNRETADEVAAQLAEEQVFGGDAQRVNTSLDKLKAVTPQEIQRVARAYLVPEKMTIVQYRPGATGQEGQAAADAQAAKATEVIQAEVAKSPEVVPPRVTEFPADYPKTIPQPAPLSKVVFDKGIEQSVKGVQVVTLNDSRLPLVNLSLILRAGSHAEPADKAGLGDLTAQMMRRGSGGIPFLEFAADLESRGIAVEITDSGDNTRLNIACTSDQLDYALDKAAAILGEPNFAPEEFAKLKQQAIGRLTQALSNPATAASRTLAASLYPQSPLGRSATPQSLAGITLDDVKQWYAAAYQPAQAVLIISGDVKPENGPQTAERLLAKFKESGKPPTMIYPPTEKPAKRRVVLVDNPQGQQATIRLGILAYDVRSDDKFAGSVAGQILSAGIDSRLGRYVRAEKGLTYGVYAFFRPNRFGSGEFTGTVDTKPDTAADAVEAMIKVFDDLKRENVTAAELSDAQQRVAGDMLMETQQIKQQADLRVNQILNGYPIDYYDNYPQRIAEVTPDQVRAVMNQYVQNDRMTIVVVAPASVKAQLEKLGEVEVVPMPLKR